jgi:hypothetical protein
MLIIGNRIGVGADGVTPLGNGQNGLFLSGNDNVIGGTGPGEGNIIAHNGAVGLLQRRESGQYRPAQHRFAAIASTPTRSWALTCAGRMA